MLWRWAGAQIGDRTKIVSSARIAITGQLSIGADTYIGHDFLVIGGDASVSIGSAVDIGPRVTVVTGTHRVDPERRRAAGVGYSKPVGIQDGVWIGANATILGGIEVGQSSVVGACSLVHRDVAANDRVGGVPARSLRKNTALSEEKHE